MPFFVKALPVLRHMAALLVAVVSIAACDSSAIPEMGGYRLEGHWKADGLRVDGIGLPIAPDIRIFPNRIVMRAPTGEESERKRPVATTLAPLC